MDYGLQKFRKIYEILKNLEENSCNGLLSVDQMLILANDLDEEEKSDFKDRYLQKRMDKLQ